LLGYILFLFECLQNMEPYYFAMEIFADAPNFENTLIVVIKQGGGKSGSGDQ